MSDYLNSDPGDEQAEDPMEGRVLEQPDDGLIPMSESERDALANRIGREIDASSQDRDNLLSRWTRNLQIYYADPLATVKNVIEGIGSYPVSLWRSKCDRLVGDLVNGITSASVVVQVIEESPDGKNETLLEQALMQVAAAAGFARCLPMAVHQGANTNIGVYRTRPVYGPDIEGKEALGVEDEWFEPKDFIAYPTAFEQLKQCKTIGHRTYRMLYEISHDQKEKLYYPAEIHSGDDPNQYDQQAGNSSATVSVTTESAEDGYVELWEVITIAKVGGEWKKVLCTIAKRDRKLLSCQLYTYSEPWYCIFRLCRTEKRIFCEDSVANSVQGYCLAAQDLLNFIVVGALVTATPVVWARGLVNPKQADQIKPGQIINLQNGGEMGVLGLPFDASKFSHAMEMFMELTDQTVGISRLGTSGNLPVQTKATAINAITAGDERRQASYLDAVAEAVEAIFRQYLEYLIHHLPELQRQLGGAVAQLTPEILSKRFRLEVTGKSGASNPSTMMQKAQLLMQSATNPMSGLDYAKVEQRLVEYMDFAFDASGLEKDDVTELRQICEQLKASGQDPLQLLEIGLQVTQSQEAANAGGPNTNGPGVPGLGAPQGVPSGLPPGASGGVGPMSPGGA